MRRSRLRGVLAAVGAASVFFSVPAGAAAAPSTSALPARIYAPYFETWTTDGIAAWLTLQLTRAQWLVVQLAGSPPATQTLVHLYTALTWALLGLDAFIGLLILSQRRRKATALDRPGPTAAIPHITAGGTTQ